MSNLRDSKNGNNVSIMRAAGVPDGDDPLLLLEELSATRGERRTMSKTNGGRRPSMAVVPVSTSRRASHTDGICTPKRLQSRQQPALEDRRRQSSSSNPSTFVYVHDEPSQSSPLIEYILSLISTQLYITFRFTIIYIIIPLLYMYNIHLRAQSNQLVVHASSSSAMPSYSHHSIPTSTHSQHNSWDALKEQQKQPFFVYDHQKHEHVPTKTFVEEQHNDEITLEDIPTANHSPRDIFHTYSEDPEVNRETSSPRHHHRQREHSSSSNRPPHNDASFSYTNKRPMQDNLNHHSQALSTVPKRSFFSKVFRFPQTLLHALWHYFSPKHISRYIFTKLGYAILALSSFIYVWIIRIKNLILEMIGIFVASIIVLWPFLMHEEDIRVAEEEETEEDNESPTRDRYHWDERNGDISVQHYPSVSKRRRRVSSETSSTQQQRQRKRGFIWRNCTRCLYLGCCFPCICSYRVVRTLLYMSFVVCALAITIGGMLAIGIGFATELVWIPYFTWALRRYKRSMMGELDDHQFEVLQENVASAISSGNTNSLLKEMAIGAENASHMLSENYGMFSEYWLSTYWFWDFITSLRHVLRFYAYCGIATFVVIFILTCCGSLNSMRVWIGRKRKALSRMIEEE